MAPQTSLRLNALTGIVSGPALALGAGPIATLSGLDAYTLAVPLARAVGCGLLLFAALLLWIARRPITPVTLLAIGTIDAAWVAASLALLLAGALPLSPPGAWIVAIQADVIALLAALELRAWWRTRAPGLREGSGDVSPEPLRATDAR